MFGKSVPFRKIAGNVAKGVVAVGSVVVVVGACLSSEGACEAVVVVNNQKENERV